MWRLTITSFSVTGAEAFTQIQRAYHAPLEWVPNKQNRENFLSSGYVLVPNDYQGNFKSSALPTPLTIMDSHEDMSHAMVPHFAAQPDGKITFGDTAPLCLDASGRNSGDAVRVNLCNDGPSQKWNFVPDGHGRTLIQLQETHACLDVDDTQHNFNRAQPHVELRECNFEGTDVWKFGESAPLPRQSLSFVLHLMISSLLLGALSLSARLWQRWRKTHTMIPSLSGALATSSQGGVALTAPLAARLEGSQSIVPAKMASSSILVQTRLPHPTMRLQPGDTSLDPGASNCWRLSDRLNGAYVGRRLEEGGRMRRDNVKMSINDQSLVRLDKLLAERGAGSRKDVDRLIRKGRVTLNGEVVAKSGAKLKVPFSSCPCVDDFDYPPPPILAAYHKPLGVISSMKDEYGRPDLAAVLPLTWQSSMHPVGRLDRDTTGLLLFSRDGDLTQKLLHPKYVVEREYLAEVENPIDAAALRAQLAEGVETIEDGESLVVQAQLLEVCEQTVRLTVTEGKYHMVRRVLANAGHPVTALHRVRIGEVRLDALELEEGDAVAIEGDALKWVTSISAAAPAPVVQRSAAGGVGGSVSRRTNRRDNDGLQARADAEANLLANATWAADMETLESTVLSVADAADVSRETAVRVLEKHGGDISAAMKELEL